MGIKYVSKETHNKQVVYQGTTEQILAFLDKPGIKEFLDVKSVNGNNVTVTTFQHESPVCGCSFFGPKKGMQTFTLSSDPSEKQVLYQRRGFTKFWCFKTLPQFSEECSLFGPMDAQDPPRHFPITDAQQVCLTLLEDFRAEDHVR